MKMIRPLFAAALGLAALGSLSPAHADNLMVCQNDLSGASSGSRTIGGTLSQVPSGTIYTLNSNGCVAVTLQDYGYFLSQGFSPSTTMTATEINTGVATGTTDFTMPMPAKSVILAICFSNSVAAAVTGGISVGTSANGTQVVTAQAVGSSGDACVPPASLTLSNPVTTGLAYTLHFAAVTAWNSANVTINVLWGRY